LYSCCYIFKAKKAGPENLNFIESKSVPKREKISFCLSEQVNYQNVYFLISKPVFCGSCPITFENARGYIKNLYHQLCNTVGYKKGSIQKIKAER